MLCRGHAHLLPGHLRGAAGASAGSTPRAGGGGAGAPQPGQQWARHPFAPYTDAGGAHGFDAGGAAAGQRARGLQPAPGSGHGREHGLHAGLLGAPGQRLSSRSLSGGSQASHAAGALHRGALLAGLDGPMGSGGSLAGGLSSQGSAASPAAGAPVGPYSQAWGGSMPGSSELWEQDSGGRLERMGSDRAAQQQRALHELLLAQLAAAGQPQAWPQPLRSAPGSAGLLQPAGDAPSYGAWAQRQPPDARGLAPGLPAPARPALGAPPHAGEHVMHARAHPLLPGATQGFFGAQ